MTINILTLFPKMFESVFDDSIIKRAKEKGIIKINIFNLRDWATDSHKTVDDKPYGGGAGMVLKVDVIDRALHEIRLKAKSQKPKTILLTPQGKTYNQKIAQKLSKIENLILICGHYEGFDERVRQLVDEEISIGNYVLTGGEIPAMVLVDSISRLIPNVLGKDESSQEESFSMSKEYGKIEYSQYTRPESYIPISKKVKKNLNVPKILLSGDHQRIKQWRIDQSLKKSELKNNSKAK